MARAKARKKHGRASRKNQSQRKVVPKLAPAQPRFTVTKGFTWLGSTGLILAALTAWFTYLARDVELGFSKNLTLGYELQLKNTGPADQVVEKFRVLPPTGQQVIYKITEDVSGTFHPDGTVSLPGGNKMYVPAAEFKELDGKEIPAQSTLKFRVPPLADRSWVQPEAALVDIEYFVISKNPFLYRVESALRLVGLSSGQKKASFLVINNYWSPVQPGSIKSAIAQACREDAMIAKLSVCRS